MESFMIKQTDFLPHELKLILISTIDDLKHLIKMLQLQIVVGL